MRELGRPEVDVTARGVEAIVPSDLTVKLGQKRRWAARSLLSAELLRWTIIEPPGQRRLQLKG
jgi:hypothetical protein